MKLERPRKPLQFVALTLPHKQLPDYPDCGSWKVNADNSPAFIGAADTGDDISNAAILLHEFIEVMMCWIHGVKEESVSKFDKMWFEEQEKGLHTSDDEPGYDPRAPYRDWHLVAERFEREFVVQAGMMWNQHCENINKVYSDG
jgi:hypothetical protein